MLPLVEPIDPNYQILVAAAFVSTTAAFLERLKQLVDHQPSLRRSPSSWFLEPLKKFSARFISLLPYSCQIGNLLFSSPSIEICMNFLLQVSPIGNEVDWQ